MSDLIATTGGGGFTLPQYADPATPHTPLPHGTPHVFVAATPDGEPIDEIPIATEDENSDNESETGIVDGVADVFQPPGSATQPMQRTAQENARQATTLDTPPANQLAMRDEWNDPPVYDFNTTGQPVRAGILTPRGLCFLANDTAGTDVDAMRLQDFQIQALHNITEAEVDLAAAGGGYEVRDALSLCERS